ncbi:WecB/TagA/CpsF family glycosyltransferase [Rossellomorea aquimaris]|uniref:WecB/TagA/CpsF family glycosyltransferase n=1 Tax=Rossellomorea aquimaris TaxID=189382 RepID=UPI001CD329C6|nr:WecB/TagA/CpsF family glycosyltransferase [Rossellomorea aquimaris]MCA1055166.1 WecB/TagA/CpsF family glycosyltransferase [Rossellomorea aquimaris]
MKENYLGVDVCTFNYEQISTSILNDIENDKKSFIVAINPEKIMKARKDKELLTLLNNADYQIPDGIGVVVASKLKGGKIKERVTGIDLMMHLCKVCESNGKSIFLYGGKPGVAETAKDKLIKDFPSIRIVGVIDGYEQDQEYIKEKINNANPDIIFVALGSPKQENWILENMNTSSPSIYQGVGGSFDVIAGNIDRAPEFLQKFGLEWFYRLLKEPWRWKRQILLPKFLIAVLTSRN